MSGILPIYGHTVVQIAYHVPDIEASAVQMAHQFGAGPFFISKGIQLSQGWHRGENCPFVHSSAYGQWGDVMVELVQQESEGPSPFRDLYEPFERGLHHLAVMTSDLKASYKHFERQGLMLATRAVTLSGVEFAFIDALDSLGHFIEIYESSEQLLGFYQMVKEAAVNFDVEDPIRYLN